MWPISYFQRKSEERKQALKKEILEEILPELERNKEELVRSGQKEVAEFFEKKKKGLETQVKKLSDDVSKYESKSRNAIESASTVKKDSKRLKAAAEATQEKAKSVIDTIEEMQAIVKNAEKLAGDIDAKFEEYMTRAVEQCTEKVGSLESELLHSLREDHQLNLNDATELLDENNSKRIGEWHAEINKKADEAVQKLQEITVEYAGKLKPLTEQSQAILVQLQDDASYLVDTFRYIRQNIPLVAYALQLSDQQKHFLRELFGEKYGGDLNSLRKDIREKSRDLQGQRNISPDELSRKFAERDISEMVGYVKRQKRNLLALLETVDRIDNVYKRGSSGRNRRQ